MERILASRNKQVVIDIESTYNLTCAFKHGDENVFEFCYKYFTDDDFVCYFPHKSFCVAFIYSRILSLVFNISQREILLSDKLLDDDQYYQPYNDDTKLIYDFMIEHFNDFLNHPLTKNVEFTMYFCVREFIPSLKTLS